VNAYVLADLVGRPLAKYLLKTYFNDAAADVGAGLLNIASRYMHGHAEQREAKRQFESLADKIIDRLARISHRFVEKGRLL